MALEVVYDDTPVRFTIEVSYDARIRNIALPMNKPESLEVFIKEYRGDIHCISYIIYEHGRAIYHWMRSEA